MPEETTLAAEAGHWYYADGSPCYSLIGKNGKERTTTLRDARKLKLLPSVSAIIRMAAAPGLEAWKQQQVLWSALTLTRKEGETDKEFIARIMEDSKERGRKASERGKLIHGAVECSIRGDEYPAQYERHVKAVWTLTDFLGINLATGKAEHTFANPLGYGGKVDWHEEDIFDFKTKDKIEDKVRYAYDDHVMQLAAYHKGLRLNGRAISVFIGEEDARVIHYEWAPEELEWGWQMFCALLNFWQLKTGYNPCKPQITPTL